MTKKFYEEDNAVNPRMLFVSSQPVGYTEITDPGRLKYLYKVKYLSRKSDGRDYIASFTADRYLDIMNNVYTSAEVFDLEIHLKDVTEEINLGWWLTAQNTNANLALSGIYDQAMKDSIQTSIDTYVTKKY